MISWCQFTECRNWPCLWTNHKQLQTLRTTVSFTETCKQKAFITTIKLISSGHSVYLSAPKEGLQVLEIQATSGVSVIVQFLIGSSLQLPYLFATLYHHLVNSKITLNMILFTITGLDKPIDTHWYPQQKVYLELYCYRQKKSTNGY